MGPENIKIEPVQLSPEGPKLETGSIRIYLDRHGSLEPGPIVHPLCGLLWSLELLENYHFQYTIRIDFFNKNFWRSLRCAPLKRGVTFDFGCVTFAYAHCYI